MLSGYNKKSTSLLRHRSVPSVFDTLQQFVLETPPKEGTNDDLLQHMIAIEREIQERMIEKDSSYKSIPRFYFKAGSKQASEPGLAAQLKQAARRKYIEDNSSLILDSVELDKIWELLLNNATPPVVDGDEKVRWALLLPLLLFAFLIAKPYFTSSFSTD